MAVLYGHTGRVLYNDGVDAPARLSRHGALFTQDVGGKYADAVDDGRVFISADRTAALAGVAIPVYTSVTPVGNVIWNPAGSGVKIRPISFSIAQVSGNPVVTPIVLMHRLGAGSEIATGAVFTAFAKTTPVNALVGAGQASKVFSSNVGTCTLTAGGVIGDVLYDMFGLPAITAQAIAFTQLTEHFDGRMAFMPGTVIWVVGTAASVALYRQTWIWEEVPV